jgi:hypothetical protein
MWIDRTVNWKGAVLVGVLGFGLYQYQTSRPVYPPSGVLVVQQPVQADTEQARFPFKAYTLTPLQSFSIEARVLGVERYRFDRVADLSPVDFALGWGPMSDGAVLQHIDIRQGGRFYSWRSQSMPVGRQDIERSSANMHMVPANSVIERRLKSVREGQVVRIDGWLVEAHRGDGFTWRSSLTRNDTGAGACELIFVNSVEIR